VKNLTTIARNFSPVRARGERNKMPGHLLDEG
jgi:hypothetical protein